MTSDEFRRYGYQAIDWVADYLEGADRYPVFCLLSFRLSLVGKWDLVRPGDDKIEESLHRGQLEAVVSTGSRHHVSDRQYRSHAFMRAQEAPVGSRP